MNMYGMTELIRNALNRKLIWIQIYFKSICCKYVIEHLQDVNTGPEALQVNFFNLIFKSYIYH